MNVDKSLRLPEDGYLHDTPKKTLIVLHHTVGGKANTSFAYWRDDPQRIATAYLVERDGTVYEVFPPEQWAYHLGLKGTQGKVDRRSVGIEIASEGGLLFRDNRYFAFDRMADGTEFKGQVYDHGSKWRGAYQYFAAYTAEQLASVFELVKLLLSQFSIPVQTPRNHTAADLARWKDYQGILSHSHLRPDKTDVHPGFPWDDLIQKCSLTQTS